MKRRSLSLAALLSLLGGILLWMAATAPPQKLPYTEAGLTEREAAAHLLSRFTYGIRPGDVDAVVTMGLETWLARQLAGDLPNEALAERLAPLKALDLSTLEIARTYVGPGVLLRMAEREGKLSREELSTLDQRERRALLRELMEDNGLRPQRELTGELMGQKLLRAAYSENQLHEVLTDFWFNHFNVALQDNQARPHLLSYERDAIRPHVTGSFREMLGATAKHPAMLLYLDNAQSTSPDSVKTTLDARMEPFEQQRGLRGRVARRRLQEGRQQRQRRQQEAEQDIPEQFRPRRGINENYARELMELHTLGVDGGYTQQDVEEVARAFSGWTVVPARRSEQIQNRMARGGAQGGFVVDGAFLFRADAHDATAKTVLGESFGEGGGLEEGERVLDLLAAHPATAHHLAHKLAVRYVSDVPPPELVDTLAEVYLETAGDLRAMIEALAYDPAFWQASARRAKVKAPFELAVSAVRALNADLRNGRALIEWIDKMGQPLYRYQAPTGFPDAADTWVNAGSLLNRMNFGLQLATGKLRGVRFDLLALNQHREPGSVEEALAAYLPLLLPERDVEETMALLLPIAQDPGLADKLETSTTADSPPDPEMDDALTMPHDLAGDERFASTDPASLARVVGVILGSPDFQRR